MSSRFDLGGSDRLKCPVFRRCFFDIRDDFLTGPRVMGPLANPGRENVEFGIGEFSAGRLGGHAQLFVPIRNRTDDQARRRIARHNCRPAVTAPFPAILRVEP